MSTTDENSVPARATKKGFEVTKAWKIGIFLAGVLLPTGTILFELLTRICSGIFDPMPTVMHLVLLFLVPLSNLLAIWTCTKRQPELSTLSAALLGVGFGVSVVYSVALLPLIPFSLFAIMFFGLGLLPLSPYLAVWCGISAYIRVRKTNPSSPRKQTLALCGGLCLSLVLLLGYVATVWVTNTGLHMAKSQDEATSRKGIQLIRSFGNKTALLRACYDQSTSFWAQGPFFDTRSDCVTPEQARSIFYRVTGKAFNSVTQPKFLGPRTQFVEEFEFDSDLGGTAVNGRVRDLSMQSSRIDALVKPDALTAYTEWIMVFSNSSSDQKEARAEIALPPGGVVSRLTLWVDGEEREAAFSTRGKVRSAYRQVAVVERHDPVLVTTCGPDRVLVQCFPVPPNGTMKIRFGVTSPLIPEGYSKCLFVLPKIVEKNFAIPDGVSYSFYGESTSTMAFEENAANPSNIITESLTESQLSGSRNHILCDRNPAVRDVWAPDMLDPKHYAIEQTLAPAAVAAPKNVVVVVDGSICMSDARSEIADELKKLPSGCRFAVIQAGDETTELTKLEPVSDRSLQDAADKIRRMRCAGGIDNRDALLKAYRLLAQNSDSVIVWIHGPQPLASSAKTEQIMQLWEKRPDSLKIISVTATDGRNSILADLERTNAVTPIPRVASLAKDLKRLFNSWNGNNKPLVVTRKRVFLQSAKGVHSWSHIARLWAREETMRICGRGREYLIPEASVLAARHQLVTAVSGAVVLETEQQYKDAGLKSVDPKSVPSSVPSSVPEPSTLIALATGLTGLAAVGFRTRKK